MSKFVGLKTMIAKEKTMKRVRLLSLFTVLLFALAFGDVSSIMAQDVLSGDDCLDIQAGPQSYFEFGGGPECPPLPAEWK